MYDLYSPEEKHGMRRSMKNVLITQYLLTLILGLQMSVLVRSIFVDGWGSTQMWVISVLTLVDLACVTFITIKFYGMIMTLLEEFFAALSKGRVVVVEHKAAKEAGQ